MAFFVCLEITHTYTVPASDDVAIGSIILAIVCVNFAIPSVGGICVAVAEILYLALKSDVLVFVLDADTVPDVLYDPDAFTEPNPHEALTDTDPEASVFLDDADVEVLAVLCFISMLKSTAKSFIAKHGTGAIAISGICIV